MLVEFLSFMKINNRKNACNKQIKKGKIFLEFPEKNQNILKRKREKKILTCLLSALLIFYVIIILNICIAKTLISLLKEYDLLKLSLLVSSSIKSLNICLHQEKVVIS